MAVEPTIEELHMTWWDLLQKIAVTQDWTYAALWEAAEDRPFELKLKQGFFNFWVQSNDDANGRLKVAHLFYELYSRCTFSYGVGFAGHAIANKSEGLLWKTGDELENLERPVESQTYFLKAAGIQTIVCLPLPSVSSTLVLELGTVRKVMVGELLAYDIEKVLLDLLGSYLPHLIRKNPNPQLNTSPQFNENIGLLGGQPVRVSNRPRELSNRPSSTVPVTIDPQANDVRMFTRNVEEISPKPFLGHGYQPFMQEPESYARHIARKEVGPELAVATPDSRLLWDHEAVSPFLQAELCAFQSSWPSTLTAIHTTLPTSSVTSPHLVDDIEPEIMPFSQLDQSLNAFMSAELQNMMAGTSLRGSSSRGSLRSQNLEENEISSAILESYADCRISELDNATSTIACGTPGRASDPSSKETSPDNTVQPLRQYGIHPRISSQPLNKLPATIASTSQQQPKSLILERQHSDTMDKEEDTTPRLVKFGNVLQLGNASGQVIEAPPQEHDEAAVSHMMAERRRRNKQNENFNELKTLIPGAAKMDKASLLAATIQFINHLKQRVVDLEQINQSLKSQISAERDPSSSSDGSVPTGRAKGSPTKLRRVMSPECQSPRTEDIILVSPEGDGNLRIEIRNPCIQPETSIHIFACLKNLHFKVINANVEVNENRFQATIVVKMKRKNSAGQTAVCTEVEKALRICLSKLE